jgi:hypothetical protein
MLDFAGLVHTALQGTFSRPFVVTPYASQPENPQPYSGRGVYSTAPVDILPELNLAVSDQRTSLWVSASEFPIHPMRDDQIEIPANLNYPAEGTFIIEDVDRHASGKMILTLKKPPQ